MLQINLEAHLDPTPLHDWIITPKHPDWKTALREWKNAEYFVLDIETADSYDQTGNGLDHFRGKIRLIQICLPSNRTLLFDVFNDDPTHFIPMLKRTVESPNQSVIGQYIIFDLTWLLVNYGITARRVKDTQILSKMRWCGIKYYKHDLKSIFKRLFGEDMSKHEQVSHWAQPNLSTSQLNYAAMDVVNTMRCYLELIQQLYELEPIRAINGDEPMYSLLELAKIECESIPAFASMQTKGYPVDVEYGKQVAKQYEEAMKDLYAPCLKELGLPYSANTEKLANSIYWAWGIQLVIPSKDADPNEPGTLKKLRGKYLTAKKAPISIPPGCVISTQAATLFQKSVEHENQLLLRVALCRSLKKCLDAINSLVESAEDLQDGRARTRYQTLGDTSTGRSTSRGGGKSTLKMLNLQNLANELSHPLLKKYELPPPRAIIRPKEGSKLSIVDLSSSH